MNVFEAYEKYVKEDEQPIATDNTKLFETVDEDTSNLFDTGEVTETQHDEQLVNHQFKLSEEDRNAIVTELAKLLKGGEES